MYLKSIRLFIICWIFAGEVASQELPTLSYFMNNRILYNAAATGTNESQFTAAIAARFQWTGIEGAPSTSVFWVDYKFVPQNMAIAMVVNQDKIGAYSNTNYLANYSYQIYLNKKIRLSMGLSAGAGTVSFSANNIKNIWDEQDDVYQNALYSSTAPKFGTGFQIYSNKFYASFSAPDLVVLGEPYRNVSSESFFKKKRNYVGMGGYSLRLTDRYALNSHVLVRYHELSGFKTDLNMQLALVDYFWIGASYSTSGNQTLMAGTQLSSRMKFGYAFGFRPGNTASVSLNSHELNLILFLDKLFRKTQN